MTFSTLPSPPNQHSRIQMTKTSSNLLRFQSSSPESLCMLSNSQKCHSSKPASPMIAATRRVSHLALSDEWPLLSWVSELLASWKKTTHFGLQTCCLPRLVFSPVERGRGHFESSTFGFVLVLQAHASTLMTFALGLCANVRRSAKSLIKEPTRQVVQALPLTSTKPCWPGC